MLTLNIDIETYSSEDLVSAGVHKYVNSHDFEILLFAYAIDGGEVQMVDVAQGEALPKEIKEALADPSVIKKAYNANFERTCLAKGYEVDMDSWRCTQIKAAYARISGSLDTVSKALGLPEDKLKDKSGKALIAYFSKPCKPTKSNGGRTRNLPHHDPDKWSLFKKYCKQDVVAEMAIDSALAGIEVPPEEQSLYNLDYRINSRGIGVDMDLVHGALALMEQTQAENLAEAKALTGLDNPNSISQLKPWIEARVGEELDSLDKAKVSDILDTTDSAEVKRVLELRQLLGKTSTAKYEAIAKAVDVDGRVRGLLQFYGAGTGRWAGRLVQVHNLPRNYLSVAKMDALRDIVKTQSLPLMKLAVDDISDTLSQLIRTAFGPTKGQKFIVADYSAIEARVIAWLAGERWRQDIFRTTGKIYEASAAQMFGVPIDTIVHGHPNYALRQKGKVAELALGYQGGVGALISMGALSMGIPESELASIVKLWRDASPAIVKLWYSIESAALKASQGLGLQTTHGLTFRLRECKGISFLEIGLPSGRCLYYPNIKVSQNRFGSPSISYSGLSTARKWSRLETYGGKLTENIVQAIARDCLAVTLDRLDRLGYKTVMHVHDEVILETPDTPEFTVESICDIMAEPIPWAEGLLLKGAGFESTYYRKD